MSFINTVNLGSIDSKGMIVGRNAGPALHSGSENTAIGIEALMRAQPGIAITAPKEPLFHKIKREALERQAVDNQESRRRGR